MPRIHETAARPALALALAAGLLLASPRPATAQCDCTTLPTLGAAAEYPAMGINDILVYLQGNTLGNTLDVPGNIGMTGSAGEVHLQGNASVGGKVDHEPGANVHCTPTGTCLSKIFGGINAKDMSQAHNDLLDFAAALAAMTPTQTYNGNLTGNTTIGGNGCINVIEVNGDIDIGGNKEITLSGSSEDYFVVNLTGDFFTSGNAEVVLDGMEPSNVVFNLTTPGKRVELGGGSGGDFTILAPFGEVYLHGNSGGTGAYYAGVNKLHFQGAVTYYGSPFACNNAFCPDPELTGANIQTPATPQGRATGNSSFFHAYFDLDDYEGHLEHFRLAADGRVMGTGPDANVVSDDNEAIDPVTNEFKPLTPTDQRLAYWDAAIPLRSNTNRTLYTTLPSGRVTFATSNTDIDETVLNLQAGEITAYPNQSGSGVDTLPELRDAIINYLHGQDSFNQDNDGSWTEMRPAVLGDIFHSNPLFIGNPTVLLRHEPGFEAFYQANKQRDRVVYAGANDGIFHAFAAGSWYDPNVPSDFDAGDGTELFGYVPGLLLPSAKLVPRVEDANGNRLAPSFVDGNIVAADARAGGSWKTVLMAAFREGGEGYLTLDVTNPADADYPDLLWEFSDPLLAESWSRPVITRVKLAGPGGTGDLCGVDDGDGDCKEQWVAIFGGGYFDESDPNDFDYADDPLAPGWQNEAKAVFIVSLDTGQILAKLAFDNSGATGPAEMLYAIPSQPGVIDLDGDRFADLVVIGDTGGQVWKWDLSAKGVDSDADPEIDNWTYGVFFKTDPVVMSPDVTHYRSFFYPPSAAYVNGQLHYTFATGERRNLLYYGDPAKDENNRFYVLRDPNPTGASSIPATPYGDGDVTDATPWLTDPDPTGDLGFFVKADDGEKFVTDVLIFAGYAIAASYSPDTFPGCGPGQAYLYIVQLSNGLGYFDTDATPQQEDRRFAIGTGIPSTPRISVAPNPGDDTGFINTSDKKVLTFDPPPRDPPDSSVIYWKQQF